MAGGATSPPILRAACRILVPGSTSMVILSIVTLNSFFSSAIIICLSRCRFQRIRIVRQPIIPYQTLLRIIDMPFEFIPEMPYRRRHRPCRRITQRTDRISFYLPLNIPQQIDIAFLPLPILYMPQDLLHPSRSLPAGRTLPAALMAVKPRQRQRMPDHTLVFIQYDETARSHHRSLGKTTVAQALVVHQPRLALRRLQEQVRRQDRHRRAPGDTGLQPLAAGNPPAIFVRINKLFHRYRHFDLIYPRLIDIAAGRDQFRTRRFPDTDLRIGFPAVIDDRHHGSQRLHIVHHRRTIPYPLHRREWRLDPGVAPFAFQRFDQRGLFPADIRARARMDIDLAIETRTQYILPQPPTRLRLRDRLFQYLGYPGIFAPDIDISALAT